MSWDEVCETNCPTARALSVVGDRWTLLILREMTMGARDVRLHPAEVAPRAHRTHDAPRDKSIIP